MTLRARAIDPRFAWAAQHMTFFVDGVDYFAKMTTDLAFLPCPYQQDPMLLHWFGDQLPWLLDHVPALRDACLPAATLRHFDPSATAGGAVPMAQLAEAQKELLAESARNGTLYAPAALLQFATAPPPPPSAASNGIDNDVTDAAHRWQWAALQTALYGSESYRELLVALPAWFANREVVEAATIVQQQYRNRLALRFARANRALIERKRLLDNVARAKRTFKNAAGLQAQWRGFLVRRALREATMEEVKAQERKRTQHEIELARHKAHHDQRMKEEEAAHAIQRRFKVLQAKKNAKYKRNQRDLGNSNAGALMAQTNGVALIEQARAHAHPSPLHAPPFCTPPLPAPPS